MAGRLAGDAVDYVGGLAREAIAKPLAEGDPVAALRSFVELWRAGFEQSGYRAGCPIAAVAAERHDDAPELLDRAAAAFENWREAFAECLRTAGLTPARADRMAALVVSGVEGAILLSRAERTPRPLLDVATELETAIRTAL